MNQERMWKGTLCETPAELNFELPSVPRSADAQMSITDQELAQPTMTHMILVNPKFSSPNLKVCIELTFKIYQVCLAVYD